MKRNFYVDDLLKSLNNAEEAIRQANELTKLCERGGFNLTKFMSNDRKVLSTIAAEKRANPSLDLSLDKLPIERTLRWNLDSDELGFKVAEMRKPDTMRGVLSTICTIFETVANDFNLYFSSVGSHTAIRLSHCWQEITISPVQTRPCQVQYHMLMTVSGSVP